MVSGVKSVTDYNWATVHNNFYTANKCRMENINATSLSSLMSTNEDSNFTIADDINGPALAVVVGLEFLISLE